MTAIGYVTSVYFIRRKIKPSIIIHMEGLAIHKRIKYEKELRINARNTFKVKPPNNVQNPLASIISLKTCRVIASVKELSMVMLTKHDNKRTIEKMYRPPERFNFSNQFFLSSIVVVYFLCCSNSSWLLVFCLISLDAGDSSCQAFQCLDSRV